MKQRFEAIEVSDKAWNVRDNDATRYNMPTNAITMNVRQDAAHEIASKLNQEWLRFLAAPF